MMKKYCEKAKIPSYSAEAVRNCCAFNLFAYGATEEQVSDQMGRTVCQIKRYKGMGYKKKSEKTLGRSCEDPNRASDIEKPFAIFCCGIF